MLSLAKDENAKSWLRETLVINEKQRQEMLASVDDQIISLFDSIQEDLINKSQKVANEASAEWKDMDFISKAFSGGSQNGHIQMALSNYSRNVVGPLSDKIQDSMDQIGVDGSAWAEEAMGDILYAMFAIDDRSEGLIEVDRYHSTLDEAISDTFDELKESGKIKSADAGKEIMEGLKNGVTDHTRLFDDSMIKAVESGEAALRATAKINSPSKLFAKDGEYMMDGLALGIKNKLGYLSSTMDSTIGSIFDADSAYSTGYSFGQSLANGISQAIKNATYPSLKGTMSTSGGTARMSFSAYASGGFPDPGQFFLARENGVPEMVGSIGRRTAVANNDQIVEAIKAGVYEAVVAATGGGNNQNGGQAQVVSANVNGKNLFEFVVDYARGETVRTGANPLLEF